MSENPANNFANDIKANKILVAALICGVLIFSIIVAILNWMNGPALAGEEAKYNNIFIYAVIAVGIICIAISTYRYNKEMSSLKGGSLSLIEKFSKYRTILIKHMAVCEFGAIFSVIIIFLIGELKLFAITTLILATMMSKMPTKKRIVDELELNWNEQQEL